MLEITRPYFSKTEGVSSTSANHLCNVAKERYELLETKLSKLSFIQKEITIVNSGKTAITQYPTCTDPAEVKDILKEIARLKGFIAIMRTAIKEKKSLEEKLLDYQSDELSNFKYENFKSPTRPSKTISNDDLQKYLTPAEYNRYLIIEAYASTIGQAIHNGSYSFARKKAFEAESSPVSVDENGQDTILYTSKSAVDVQSIDTIFFDLQAKHRELEAELNGLKAKVETALQTVYKQELDEYTAKVRRQNVEFSEVQARSQKERDELLDELRSFKILVPDQYKELVKSLA